MIKLCSEEIQSIIDFKNDFSDECVENAREVLQLLDNGPVVNMDITTNLMMLTRKIMNLKLGRVIPFHALLVVARAVCVCFEPVQYIIRL